MKYLFSMLILSSCFYFGCTRSPRDTTLFQANGRQKPIVAVLPLIDRSGTHDLTWELSREFTDEIRKRFYDSPRIYLLRDGGSTELAEMLNATDLKTLSRGVIDNLGAAEFAVVTELVEQKETPYGFIKNQKDKDPYLAEMGTLLNLTLRLRVLDLRDEHPKIILQEVFNRGHIIPHPNCDYAKASWGSEAFQRSPMGIAHNKLIREIASRVEAYVETAQ